MGVREPLGSFAASQLAGCGVPWDNRALSRRLSRRRPLSAVGRVTFLRAVVGEAERADANPPTATRDRDQQQMCDFQDVQSGDVQSGGAGPSYGSLAVRGGAGSSSTTTVENADPHQKKAPKAGGRSLRAR